MEYKEFLKSKRITHKHTGFDAKVESESLFPFQNHVVNKGLKDGKYGIFSGTGTGKSRMQITWSDEVAKHTGKPVLILAPLAVSGQTIEEGTKIGITVKRLTENPTEGIYIINYDQLDNIIEYIPLFGGIALDEASILKNPEGAYRNMLIENFTHTQFKSVWTATPSPNDPMEIGSYSEFLDVMPYNEMLAMYFVHDAGETQKWRLKKHSQSVFWDWVSTWAIMFQKPSDIGFEQDGYDLPPLNLIEKQIITGKRDNGLLFNDVAVSATNFNQELRLTKIERLSQVADIVNNSKETFLIWVKQNEEGEELRKLIHDAIEVKGSDTTEYKEETLLGFGKGLHRVLITKGKIAGMGMNFQICHNQIFASPDFSFETVFQGLRRSWRFMQQYAVNAWIITTDTMTNVIQTLKRKEKQFEEMQKEMTKAVNRNIQKKVKMNREFKETKNDNFHLMYGDCVQLIKKVPDESIGFTMYSPPFPSLYVYSDEIEDMGNSKDFDEFLVQYEYLVNENYRVCMSGRNVAVHCMDIPIQKGKEGYIGLRSFSNMIIELHQKAGFVFHSEIICWKNPVTEMQRTKALGLLHKQIKKDATMSRVGIPDKVLVFRKDGERNNPVSHQDTDPSKPDYLSVNMWQKYASPVWMDIDFGNTLNSKEGRDEKDERHIAPLSLDIIERCYALWTNEGDTVLTPFAGIGSELYQAIKMNRKAVGTELKSSYYELAVKNLLECVEQKKQLTLI
jgi:DNA modification methylase